MVVTPISGRPSLPEASPAVPQRQAAPSLGLPSLFNDGLDPTPKQGFVHSTPVPSTTQAQSLTRRVHELVGEALHAMGGRVAGMLQSARRVWARGLSLRFLRRRRRRLTGSVSRRAAGQRARGDRSAS